MDALIAAAKLVFDPFVLWVILASSAFGIFVGAMPGLTATMATALLVPITFFMPPVPALGAIVAATAMAIFAGDIPAAMLRIPGTPASAAYTDESYAMSRKGELDLNLGVNLVFSVIGGLVGVAILILCAPALAEFAIHFSSFEYFWLALLGLTCAIFIATDAPLKGIASLLLGLAINCIGIDPAAGYPRFTFGSVELLQGISFIPAMIGMFAVSELLRGVVAIDRRGAVLTQKIGNIFVGVWKVWKRYWLNFIRGSAIGVLIGALPGAGADIAAWISYAVSKRFSKEPEKFGTGHIEGIVDATSANNSALGGAWIPALVFGIPGDSITAIVIGVLYMKGMNPGPTVFLQNPAIHLCGVPDLHSRQPVDASARLGSDQVEQANPARAAQRPHTGHPAVLHRRLLRDDEFRLWHHRDAGHGRAGLDHGGERLPDRAGDPRSRARRNAGAEFHDLDDQIGWRLPGLLRAADRGRSRRRHVADLGDHALARHQPLDRPGRADLTARVSLAPRCMNWLASQRSAFDAAASSGCPTRIRPPVPFARYHGALRASREARRC